MTDQTNTRPAQPAGEGTAAEREAPAAAAPPQPGPARAEELPPAGAAAPADSPTPETGAPPAPGDDEEATAEAAPPAAPDAEAGPAPEAAPAREDKAAEYLELARRTQAAFDNYRKRMARENAAAADRGASKLAKELLPALDHLDLALKAASGHEDVVRGFAMVHGELIAALGRVGIQPFSPEGEPFDPSEHEAMAQRPVEGAESGIVVEVYQQGYRINGAVLRPARVVVAQ